MLQADIELGLPLIIKAMEENRDERLFQQWVVQVPWMDKENYVSFEDYKNKLTGANVDRRSVSDIEADLAEVERQLQRGGGT